MNLKKAIDNKFKSDLPLTIDKVAITDKKYWDFIETTGDGYYFNKSLHIYGASSKYKFHDINYRTKFIKDLYNKIIDNDSLVCFAEDALGNQFVFYSKGIGLLFIESGELEYLAENFAKWLEVLNGELDYYTGESLFVEWGNSNGNIDYNMRLTPKMPFVLGGEFGIDNLYNADFEKVMNFNADLANQIYDLPDGASLDIKFE